MENKDDLEKMIKVLSKQIKTDEKNENLYFVRGTVYYKLGKYEEAIEDYDRAIELDSNNYGTYNNRGNAYGGLGKNEEAIKDYGRAIELGYEDAGVYYNRGNAYRGLGKNEEAIKDYGRAIELDDEYASVYYNRGVAYVNLGKNEEAIKDYDRAIELDDKYASAYNNRGIAYTSLKRHEEAIEDYDRAIELDDEFPYAYYNRGNAYSDLGEYKRAIEDYDKAIKLDADADADVYYNKGNAYRKLGKNEEAIKDYDRAIALDDEDFAIYYNRGNAYFDLGRYEEAIENYDKAIELDSRLKLAYKNKSIAYQENGEYEKAIKTLDKIIKVLKKGEEDAELYYLRAEIYLRKIMSCTESDENYEAMNDYKKAIEDYKKSVEIDETVKYMDTELKFEILCKILQETQEGKNGKEKSLLELFESRESILETLHMKNIGKEGLVAHYTSEFVAKSILCEDKEKIEDNNDYIRMSIAYLSNDPTEGKVLFKYLGLDSTKTELYPFIACFSHELDSLNQLRLYGKKDKEEATGVAFVLENNFFSREKISPLYNSAYNDGIDTKEKIENKMALYRCVYLGYENQKLFCRISNQSRWNEFLSEKKTNYENIEKENSKVKEKFEKINQIVGELNKEYEEKIGELNKEYEKEKRELDKEYKETMELVKEILLPLQYLVKDPAFQEERECRLIYITDINNDSVKEFENADRLYVDYKVSIKEYLNHILVHEKQAHLEPYLSKISGKKAKISRNPFSL